MILITGGTGFVGRALVRQLFDAGYPVRTLLRPSPRTPRLPKGVPVEVAVVGLGDVRGLRHVRGQLPVWCVGTRSSDRRSTRQPGPV